MTQLSADFRDVADGGDPGEHAGDNGPDQGDAGQDEEERCRNERDLEDVRFGQMKTQFDRMSNLDKAFLFVYWLVRVRRVTHFYLRHRQDRTGIFFCENQELFVLKISNK